MQYVSSLIDSNSHPNFYRENALREQTELMTDIPEDAERLSPNFISKLEYLDCCMKETVRRYGIMMLVRKAMVDCPFKAASGEEFVIPKGIKCKYSLDAI